MARISMTSFGKEESAHLPLRFEFFSLSNIDRIRYWWFNLLQDWNFIGVLYLRFLQDIRNDCKINLEGVINLQLLHINKFGKCSSAMIYDICDRIVRIFGISAFAFHLETL